MAAQTLAQPSPCVHTLTKPTPAKARLIPAVGGPIVYSDVLQVLNLQGWLQWCKSMDFTAMGRCSDFNPTYVSATMPPELAEAVLWG